MSFLALRRLTFRDALVALTIGVLAIGAQLACSSRKWAPLAVVSSFTASPDTITSGQAGVLSYTFSGGTGSIDHGVGTVTSGQQLLVTPTATTTYTLTVVNSDGHPTTATATVSVKAFTGKFVYVANSGGGVSGFALNDTTGALAELGNSPWDETVKALHVTSDPAGKFLFVVNGDGETLVNTLTVYTINATTGDLTKVNSYATAADPWVTAIDPSGTHAYVRCDGAISAYTINGTTGVLTPMSPASVSTSAGVGGLVFHPAGQFLFTVGRTSNTVQVFGVNATTGALAAVGTPYALPTGAGPMGVTLSATGEFLFTKSEGPETAAISDPPVPCILYGYRVNLTTGALTALTPFDTGLVGTESYHGIFASPNKPVVYVPLYGTDSDYTAYTFNATAGTYTAIPAAPYAPFGGTGTDSLVVSRNGKWAFIPDYNDGNLAVAAVDPFSGALGTPSLTSVGNFPVSVAVVGALQ